MPKDAIVEGINVWKIYESEAGPVEALRGIDVRIEEGEMVAIMGPSGCGKTTFLNCFSGLDDVTKGTVKVEGTDIHAMSDDKKSIYRAKRMGFVFQSYNLLPVLSAVENVELPLLVAGVRPAKARKMAEKTLAELGLSEKFQSRPLALSGGQQQRVTLARALVGEPAIVWADEPTGNLDAENSQQVTDLLRSLNKSHGQTFIVVTHDAEVAKSCDRVLKMRDGNLI